VLRAYTNVIIWLCLTQEIEGMIFEGHWSTPLTTITTALFKTVAHIVPWDVLVVAGLLVARSRPLGKAVPAVGSSLRLCFGAIALMWLWGVLRGGSAYQTYFQLHAFVMGLIAAMLVTAVYRTQADVISLGRTVAFACLYRAAICITFYVLVAKNLPDGQKLAALTDHCDSVLFVGGLFLLLANALEKRGVGPWLWVLFGGALLVTAIVLNNRRIAWVGVGVGFLLIFLLMNAGKMKKRITTVLLVLAPFIAAYIAAGWGNPAPVFKPVYSLSTMVGENQDSSSMMRDIENYNLLRTLKSNPLLGYGFGKEYIEEVVAYDISNIFPQYRYLPHNSLLGVIAFTGMLGFWGIWQVVAVTVYFHARTYRHASSPSLRAGAIASIILIVVIQVQMWGDVGFNHQMVTMMLGITIGICARLPALAGLWPTLNPSGQQSRSTDAQQERSPARAA
jgi:O-Antigen ligase